MGTGNGGPVEAKPQELHEQWRSKCSGTVQTVLLSPHGLAAVLSNTSVAILDSPHGPTVRHELLYPESTPTAIDFSPKGTEVIVGYANGFLKWWGTDSGEETCSTQFPYSSASETAQGGHHHPATHSQHHTNGASFRAISDVKCCRSSGLLAAACNRAVGIFGPGGEHLHSLTAFTQAVEHLLWLREGLVAAVEGSQVRTWGVARDRPPRAGPDYTASPAASIRCALVSPNHQLLAAACGNGTAQVWALQKSPPADKRERVMPLAVFQDAFGPQINEIAVRRCMAWSPSSRLLATARASDALLWDAADLTPPAARRDATICLGHDSAAHITALAFQPAGPLLAAAADNGQLRVFDAAPLNKGGPPSVGRSLLALAAAFLRPPAAVASITWNPPASILAAASSGDLVALKPVLYTAEPAATRDTPSPIPVRSPHTQQPPQPQQQLQQPRARQPQPPLGGAPPLQPPAAGPKPAPPMSARATKPQPPAPAGWGGEPLVTASSVEVPAISSPQPFNSARNARPRPDPLSNGPPTAPPHPRGTPPRSATPPGTTAAATARNPAGPPPPRPGPPSASHTPTPTPPSPARSPQLTPSQTGATVGSSTTSSRAGSSIGGAPPSGVPNPSKGVAGRPQRAKQVPSPAEAPMAYWREMGYPLGTPDAPGSPVPGGGWGMAMNAMAMQRWGMPPSMPMMPYATQMMPGMPPYMAPPPPGPAPGPMSPPYGSKGMPPMPGGGYPGMRPGMPPMAGGHPMAQPLPPAMGAYMAYATPNPQHMAQWGMPAYPPQQWQPYYYFYPQPQATSVQGTPRTSSSGLPVDTPTPSTPGTPRPARPPSVSAASDASAALDAADPSSSSEAGRAVVTLYVGNLAANVTEEVLVHHFASFGTIQSVQVIRDRTTSASRGFGFVTFQHPQAAAAAMKHMNGQVLMGPYEGRAIKVSPSNRR